MICDKCGDATSIDFLKSIDHGDHIEWHCFNCIALDKEAEECLKHLRDFEMDYLEAMDAFATREGHTGVEAHCSAAVYASLRSGLELSEGFGHLKKLGYQGV